MPVDPQRLVLTLGCQRSGTTLVHLILDRHPQIVSLDEPDSYRFLRREREALRRAAGGGLISLKIPRMGEFPRLAQLRRLLDGGARGIFVYRDPHGVAASMMRLELDIGRWAAIFPRREAPVLARACGLTLPEEFAAWSEWRLCLNHIALKHRFYRMHLAHYPLLNVCYERLVEQPRHWVDRIAEHLGLVPDQEMLEHHRHGTGEAMGGTRRDRPIDRHSLDGWQASLTAEQAAEVELYCAEPLAFWRAGYHGEGCRSPEAEAQDGRVAHRFDLHRDLQRGGLPAPLLGEHPPAQPRPL
jgi:hypothetical protein